MDTKLQQLSPRRGPPASVSDHPSHGQLPPSRQPLEQPEPATQFSLRDYWRLIHGRRRTILWAVVSSLLTTTIYNFLRVPTYRAKATIQIDREEPNIAQLDESLPQLPEHPEYIETQYKILESRTLAKRVISKLGLDERAEFRQGLSRDTPTPGAETNTHEQIHPMIVENYLDRLGVHPGKGTRLVDVTFESVDRELAPKVVNTLAEEYIEYNFEAKWNATQKASTWLEQQLSHLQAKLEASESDLQDYAAAHSILFVEERKNITTEKLAQLEEELTRVQALRIERQSRAMLAQDALARGGDPPSSLTSETSRRIESELTDLRRDYAQLMVTFAPGYPKVRRVKRQIDELEQALQAEQGRTFSGVSESFQLAVRRERLLEGEVARQRGLVNRLSDDFIEYDILKRDAETNRQLYEGLLQRLKEAGISAGLRASNIAVLDVAEAADEPFRPKKLHNLSMALLAGLALGVALAFVQEHMDTVVRTPEEVEGLTGLSLLAVVPRSRRKDAPKVATTGLPEQVPAFPRTIAAPPLHGTQDRPPEVRDSRRVQWNPDPELSEAYRALRTSILLGWDETMRRTLVTSSQPQEGKTTVSLNLACSLAQLGRPTLLIDGDMRRPNCAKQLSVNAEYGLSDYLQGLAEFEQVVSETPIRDLSLIAAGRFHSTASDLLYSPRLRFLLQQAGEGFQHVVIDSPPSLVLSDARTISRLVEGVILVVSDETDRGALSRTKQTFDEAGVRLLGFVMNRVDLDHLDYGYYRNYGYYYSYSDSG